MKERRLSSHPTTHRGQGSRPCADRLRGWLHLGARFVRRLGCKQCSVSAAMCSRLYSRGGLSWFERLHPLLDPKATPDNLLLIRYLRFSTYAINAFKSSGGRSIGGMPPAFIFAVGCLNSSAS